MKFTQKTPRASVTIQKNQFDVPQPYEEGHSLNANEAAALNQLVCENIRNNQAKVVSDGLAAGKTVDELQKVIDEYCVTYEFGVRRKGSRGDPVMAKAIEIASEKVREALKKKGVTLKTVTAAEIRAKAEAAVKQHPQILEAAKIIVAQSDKTLSGLSLDDEE